MAVPVFCNVCFCEPRKPTPRFSLTSCGHVICEICLQKGKKDECLICRIPCHTLVLSKQNLAKLKQGEEDNATKSKKITANRQNANIIQRNNAHSSQIKKPKKPLIKLLKQTNPDIQSLFMGIDTLCKKYSKEISQISEFQEKHRKHLLAYNRQKSFTSAKRAYISHKQYDFIKVYQTVKLEESLKKVTQQMHQIQCMKLPEQTTQCPFSSASRNPLSIPSRKQDGYSSCSLHPSHPSSSEIMESMEIDPVPSSMRKPETPTGPTRLSLITPPQDGRMGSVSYRGTQSSGIMSSQNSRAGSTRSTPIKLPHSGCSLTSSSGSQSSRRGSWAASDFRTPQLYPFTSPSPQSSVTRQPITISGLLQRQHLGATNLGGHSTER